MVAVRLTFLRSPGLLASVLELAIGVPAYGGSVDIGHINMWLTLGHSLAVNADKFNLRTQAVVDGCLVDVARNTMLAQAVETGCDWLLMVDADTSFAPKDEEAAEGPGAANEVAGGKEVGDIEEVGDLLQMIYEGEKRSAAAIGGAVRKRDPQDPHFTVYRQSGAESLPIPEAEFLGRVVPVDRVGAAILGVNVNWVRRHWPEPPWFEVRHLPRLKVLGEDLFFTEGVKSRGGEIFVDGRVVGDHVQRRQLVRPPI